MPRHAGWAVHIVVSVLVCLAAPVIACQVPVFRYALENWQPEPYLLIVAHRGALSSSDKSLLEQLERTVRQQGEALNLDLKVVDLSKTKEPVLETVLGTKTERIQSPQMVLIYPFDQVPTTADGSPAGAGKGRTPVPPGPAAAQPALTAAPPGLTAVPPGLATCPDGKCGLHSGTARLAWNGDLTAEHIRQVATSPARKQIGDRLLSGQSAVWVLLESGDQAKDDAAATRLENALVEMQRTLKLPDKKTIETDESFKSDTKVELKIEFSVIRIPQQRGDETIFASMLLNSDPDVAGKREPVALSVFGRGRSYYALAGADINAEAVEEHSRFLTGDCSCQVKQENPGVDLLFAVPWQKSITRSTNNEHDLPELRGVGLLETAAAISPGPAQITNAVETKVNAKGEQAISAPADAPTAPQHFTPATADSAAIVPMSRMVLTWAVAPAAIGLVVVLLGTLWLRFGRQS